MLTQDLTFTESLSACVIETVSSQSASLYLRSIDRGRPCHSKWRRSTRISVWLREVLHEFYSLSYARMTCFRFSQLHLCLSLQHGYTAICYRPYPRDSTRDWQMEFPGRNKNNTLLSWDGSVVVYHLRHPMYSWKQISSPPSKA